MAAPRFATAELIHIACIFPVELETIFGDWFACDCIVSHAVLCDRDFRRRDDSYANVGG
jgi:hypothetical protein